MTVIVVLYDKNGVLRLQVSTLFQVCLIKENVAQYFMRVRLAIECTQMIVLLSKHRVAVDQRFVSLGREYTDPYAVTLKHSFCILPRILSSSIQLFSSRCP